MNHAQNATMNTATQIGSAVSENPARVSANLASQLKRILNFIVPTGRKRLTTPRSFYSESKDDLRSCATRLPCDLSPDLQGKSVPIIRSIPSLNRQFEESGAGKP